MFFTEAERLVVFEAYAAALRAGDPMIDCHFAATAALRRLRPEIRANDAAREAVQMIADRTRFADLADAWGGPTA
jgi:hypothetical protein